MKIEAAIPFSNERIVVGGEFYIDNKTRRLFLYVEEWADTINQTDWYAFSCRVHEYNRPGVRQTQRTRSAELPMKCADVPGPLE